MIGEPGGFGFLKPAGAVTPVVRANVEVRAEELLAVRSGLRSMNGLEEGLEESFPCFFSWNGVGPSSMTEECVAEFHGSPRAEGSRG